MAVVPGVAKPVREDLGGRGGVTVDLGGVKAAQADAAPEDVKAPGQAVRDEVVRDRAECHR